MSSSLSETTAAGAPQADRADPLEIWTVLTVVCGSGEPLGCTALHGTFRTEAAARRVFFREVDACVTVRGDDNPMNLYGMLKREFICRGCRGKYWDWLGYEDSDEDEHKEAGAGDAGGAGDCGGGRGACSGGGAVGGAAAAVKSGGCTDVVVLAPAAKRPRMATAEKGACLGGTCRAVEAVRRMRDGEPAAEDFFDWGEQLLKDEPDGRAWVGAERYKFALTFFEDPDVDYISIVKLHMARSVLGE